MQVGVEAVIEAPCETVFAVVADIERWPRFISGVESVELLGGGAMVVGTRFRETRVMFGRRATEEMTVAEMAPPRRLVLTALNHGTAYRAEHSLGPMGQHTRLKLVFDGRPATLVAWLLMPLGMLFRGALKRQLAADLADLKREAERQAGRGGALRSP
jgi:carbon monoxide dehydrogenase subunit G